MNYAETLIAVANQLQSIFKDKSDLNGYNDWDRFIGCVVTILTVANALSEQPEVVTETNGE